jgi:hypothetical protein
MRIKSERLAAARTEGNAAHRVIAYGLSTAAPPVAIRGGLSAELKAEVGAR